MWPKIIPYFSELEKVAPFCETIMSKHPLERITSPQKFTESANQHQHHTFLLFPELLLSCTFLVVLLFPVPSAKATRGFPPPFTAY